jgi:isocitrate lyase
MKPLEDLAAMGYKFQFITLAGFHALNTVCSIIKAYKEKRNGGLL